MKLQGVFFLFFLKPDMSSDSEKDLTLPPAQNTRAILRRRRHSEKEKVQSELEYTSQEEVASDLAGVNNPRLSAKKKKVIKRKQKLDDSKQRFMHQWLRNQQEATGVNLSAISSLKHAFEVHPVSLPASSEEREVYLKVPPESRQPKLDNSQRSSNMASQSSANAHDQNSQQVVGNEACSDHDQLPSP